MKLILLCAVLLVAGCFEDRPMRCIDGKVMVKSDGIWIERRGYVGMTCREE